MRVIEIKELSGCHSGGHLDARARRKLGRAGGRRPSALAVPFVEDLDLESGWHSGRRRQWRCEAAVLAEAVSSLAVDPIVRGSSRQASWSVATGARGGLGPAAGCLTDARIASAAIFTVARAMRVVTARQCAQSKRGACGLTMRWRVVTVGVPGHSAVSVRLADAARRGNARTVLAECANEEKREAQHDDSLYR